MLAALEAAESAVAALTIQDSFRRHQVVQLLRSMTEQVNAVLISATLLLQRVGRSLLARRSANELRAWPRRRRSARRRSGAP